MCVTLKKILEGGEVVCRSTGVERVWRPSLSRRDVKEGMYRTGVI